MPRNRSLVAALVVLLGACRSRSAEGDAAAGDDAPGRVLRGACDQGKLARLTAALTEADARVQRDLVATELGEACTLPSALGTHLASARGSLAIPTADERGAVLHDVCPDAAVIMGQVATASASARNGLVFDGCKLARFDLIDQEEFAQVAESTVFPFYAFQWLQDQQVDPLLAKTLARAVALLDRSDLRVADQTLVGAPRPWPPVPEGVVVHVTQKAIRAGDRTLVELDAHGRVPPDAMRDRLIGPLYDTLSEEKAKSDDRASRMILVADESMPFSMLIEILYTSVRAEIPRYALVAESERLRFGAIAVDDSPVGGADAAPALGVRIDAAGFDVYAPDAADVRIDGPAGGSAWDYAALAARAAAFKAEFPDATQARVAALAEIPYGIVLSTLAAVRGPGCGAAGTCVLADAFVTDQARRAVDGIPKMSAPFDPDEMAHRPGLLARVSAGDAGDVDSVYDMIARGSTGTADATLELAKVVVKGSLDEDRVRHIVRSRLEVVRVCYEEGLARDATLAGKVTVTFQIAESGNVEHASVVDSTLADEAVGTCIVAAVEGWKFPRPTAGVVAVTSPFELAPG